MEGVPLRSRLPRSGCAMCGRFTLFSDGAELARLFGCGFEGPLQPRYNIAPSQPVPVAHLAEDQPDARQVALLHWGLGPSLASDPKIGSRSCNACSGTAACRHGLRAA